MTLKDVDFNAWYSLQEYPASIRRYKWLMEHSGRVNKEKIKAVIADLEKKLEEIKKKYPQGVNIVL